MTDSNLKLVKEKIVPEYIAWHNENKEYKVGHAGKKPKDPYASHIDYYGKDSFIHVLQMMYMDNLQSLAQNPIKGCFTDSLALPMGLSYKGLVDYDPTEYEFDLFYMEGEGMLTYAITRFLYNVPGQIIILEHGRIGCKLQWQDYQHRIKEWIG